MILVTGGTGLVGAHLLYHLLQKHPSLRAIHRASSDIAYVKEIFTYYTEDAEALFSRIDWKEANITKLPELTEAFEGITQVYHCAAFISFNPKHYKALKKANIEGTANVVNLCLAHNVEKLCYVSSIATLGDAEDGSPITEKMLWNPEAKNSVYSITKYGAEMEIWRGTQEGLNAVIVNPGVIFGEGFWKSGSGLIIQRASKGMRYYTKGSTGFVDVLDVVSAMMHLMESPIKNERFILVAENLSYEKLSTHLNQLFGKPKPKGIMPKRMLYFLSALDGISSKLFGTKRMLLKATVRSLYKQSEFDSSKIRTQAQFEFRPMEQTLARVVDAYQNTTL